MITPEAPFTATDHQLGLYPVVDTLQWIIRLLNVGVTTLQLRIKNLPDEQVEDDIKTAIALGKRYDSRLFINDYWQLAIKHGAYGVHLGQQDLLSADLVAIQQTGLRLGISTHNDDELTVAVAIKPSYIALGHIFPTQTKQMACAPQGLAKLKCHVARVGNFPTVAIGGISIDKVPQVLACGVGGVAVVSAITQATHWQTATADLLKLIEGQERANA